MTTRQDYQDQQWDAGLAAGEEAAERFPLVRTHSQTAPAGSSPSFAHAWRLGFAKVRNRLEREEADSWEPVPPGPQAKPLPPAHEHAPVSVINRTGRGVRTVITCSCGWYPTKASERSTARTVDHMTHRRVLGLPALHDYSGTVMGEGPWTGLTWNEWYAMHGGQDVDPYTGRKASDRWGGTS